jgi:uncharacterized protein (TIGR03000 family)
MYSMVLMAALTTGVDMPDRRGGCHGGCHGGCYGGWGGCYGGYGGGWGGCYGGGWGGCHGGYGGGWGGCSGSGYGGGWGGCYGGTSMSWGGYGYSGYAMGGYSPAWSGYAYSPMFSTWGTPIVSAGGTMLNPAGLSQSFYYNPAGSNEATIIVHVPANASLSIDGQQTQQRSDTRVFTSPPLEPGKTYTYTLRAEMSRDGHTVHETKNVDVRAGQSSEVTINLGDVGRGERINAPPQENTAPSQRTPTVPPSNR